MTDAELIREAVRLSGLSARVFAEVALAGRDERNVRRYQAGQPLPAGLRAWLRGYVALDDAQRKRYVAACPSPRDA